MWSTVPLANIARKLAHIPSPGVKERATRSWQLAPSVQSVRTKAYFLPDQLERVTDTAFGSLAEQVRSLSGGAEVTHAATLSYLVRDVFLFDGALYKDGAYSPLRRRTHWIPSISVDQEIERGALYCSPGGIQYFGQWLMDDCLLYPMAAAEGTPITTQQPLTKHVPCYESWLGMNPTRVQSAYIRELILFEDHGQNHSKHARARDAAAKVLRHVETKTHPGVFILRGTTGMQRILTNERELAERLRASRGLRIVDPTTLDVPELVRAVAGASIVVGVEGSGLMHGILTLPPGGTVLTLQPPNRLCSLYKDLTDRDHQHYAFVVGKPQNQGFAIDADEVERTMDLLPTGPLHLS